MNYSGSRDDIDKGLAFAEKAIELDENTAEAYNAIAYVKLFTDWDWEEAERYVKKAIEMNPARSDVYDKIAQSAFETDEFEKAIALWRQALTVDPDMVGGHVNIGRALMRLSQYEACLPEIEKEIDYRVALGAGAKVHIRRLTTI